MKSWDIYSLNCWQVFVLFCFGILLWNFDCWQSISVITPRSYLNLTLINPPPPPICCVRKNTFKQDIVNTENMLLNMCRYSHFHCESFDEFLHLRCGSYLQKHIDLSHAHICAVRVEQPITLFVYWHLREVQNVSLLR